LTKNECIYRFTFGFYLRFVIGWTRVLSIVTRQSLTFERRRRVDDGIGRVRLNERLARRDLSRHVANVCFRENHMTRSARPKTFGRRDSRAPSYTRRTATTSCRNRCFRRPKTTRSPREARDTILMSYDKADDEAYRKRVEETSTEFGKPDFLNQSALFSIIVVFQSEFQIFSRDLMTIKNNWRMRPIYDRSAFQNSTQSLLKTTPR